MKSHYAALRALQPLPGVILALASAAAAWVIRYGFIEPERLGAACEKAGPWWCAPRTAFIVFTQWNGFGWLALAFAALAGIWFFKGKKSLAFALLAMTVGGAGLILYNAGFSAVAVVAGLLLLSQHQKNPA